MGGVVLFFLSKPPIHQKYSSLPHTQTFMSPSSFPLTHKHSQPKMIPLHPPTQHRAHLQDVPHLSITSAHLPTLPARTPMQRGIEGAPGEGGGENHSSLRKHQMVWKHCPKAQSLKGLIPTDCLFLFPASCESRLHYHLHHLLWQGWFNRSTPALGMSSCSIFFSPVNCAVISRLAWPFERQSRRLTCRKGHGCCGACAASRSPAWLLNMSLMVALHRGSVQRQVGILFVSWNNGGESGAPRLWLENERWFAFWQWSYFIRWQGFI